VIKYTPLISTGGKTHAVNTFTALIIENLLYSGYNILP
jgi:hypothetical protein